MSVWGRIFLKIKQSDLFKTEEDELELQEDDIYSYTFFKFIYCKNEMLLAELMMLLFITIFIQIGVIVLMFQSKTLRDAPIFVGDAQINITRLMSAYILHVYLHPSTQLAIDMLQYITYKGKTFYGRHVFFPFLIFLGKLLGNVMTQALTVYSLIKKTTIVDVINGWIASFLIGQISTFMALALVKFDVNGEMASKKIMF